MGCLECEVQLHSSHRAKEKGLKYLAMAWEVRGESQLVNAHRPC